MIEKLLLKQEQFPWNVVNSQKLHVPMPPYHPSMGNGMDVELASSAIAEGIENFIVELGTVPIGISFVTEALDSYKGIDPVIIDMGESNKVVRNVPLFGKLYISDYSIGPVPKKGTGGIFIDPEESRKTLFVPSNIQLPKRLMQEYEMSVLATQLPLGLTYIGCTHQWIEDNKNSVHLLLYRNLAFAIANAVVKQKYANE